MSDSPGVRKLIAICTPTLGTVSVNWALQYGGVVVPMNTSSAKIFCWGKPTAEGRNELVARALSYHKPGKLELSYIFWIDDDVLVPQYSLQQLMSRNVPIVSGVYFTKGEFSAPLIFDGPGMGHREFVPDVFEEVGGHGMGLTLVAREVYERIRDELDIGKDQYGMPCWYRTYRNEPLESDEEGMENMRVGSQTEDFYFLALAKQLGYTTYIDCSPYAFGWHYDKDRHMAYPQDKWAEYTTKGTITWPSPNGGEPVVWTRNITTARPDRPPMKTLCLGVLP